MLNRLRYSFGGPNHRAIWATSLSLRLTQAKEKMSLLVASFSDNDCEEFGRKTSERVGRWFELGMVSLSIHSALLDGDVRETGISTPLSLLVHCRSNIQTPITPRHLTWKKNFSLTMITTRTYPVFRALSWSIRLESSAATPPKSSFYRPLLGRYDYLPCELFRINNSNRVTLRDYKKQIESGRTSYDLRTHEDGLVHPKLGPMFEGV